MNKIRDMDIKTLVVYTFSFSNPDDVDIFTNQAHRLALQGYKPLLPPSVFNDTVIQQWGRDEDTKRINSLDFKLFLQRQMLDFSKKWDRRQWAVAYEDFSEWLMGVNSTWSANKSSMALYRKYAIEHYTEADILKDGFCLKGRYK